MRTAAVVLVLAATHAPAGAWLFLALVWVLFPRWRVQTW